MKIEFSVDGGIAHFPGLAKPSCVDLDALPATAAARIRALVAASRFFARTSPVETVALPDARTYTLAIEDDGRRRSLRVAEPIGDPNLTALIDAVRRALREQR